MSKWAAVSALTFEKRHGRIITSEYYYRGNAKISSQMPTNEPAPYYFLITIGGGFVEGESYLTKIHVKEKASAVITSQAPTYIYRCLNGEKTRQIIDLTVEDEGSLEFLVDDLIPYAQSNFCQKATIHLGEHSTLFYLDGLTSGWSQDEQRFTYEHLRLDTEIYFKDQLIVNDKMIIEPRNYETMTQLGLFEEYSNYNSLIVINEAIDEQYIQRVRHLLEQYEVEATFGISQLEYPGFILRVLGKTMDDNKTLIYACANLCRQDLLHFPQYQLRKNDYMEQKRREVS